MVEPDYQLLNQKPSCGDKINKIQALLELNSLIILIKIALFMM
jgi:hypothetical protein